MLKFILSSKFHLNKSSLFTLTNNFKTFARKEINKANLIENFHNINRIETKPEKIQNLNINQSKEILTNLTPFGLDESKNLLDKNFISLKQNDTPQTKFLSSIRKNLGDNNILQNQKFLDCLNEIAINYSQPDPNFFHSTVFKFLVLFDQILTKKSLADYQKVSVTHFAFPHLINYFGENFFTIFEKNSDNLLNYNFLYFMSINKGEFSECLKILIETLPSNQNLHKLLSTRFAIKKENSEIEKIHNREYFDFIEKNVTTPSSNLIRDFSFKYNEKNLKIKLINENVREQQEYEKVRLIYNNLIKYKNSNETINSTFLNELELYLNTFFPQLINNSKINLSDDYLKIKKAIDDFNKYLQNKLDNFSIIPINNKIKESITFLNIQEIFNPLFSGENDLSKQFTIVAEHFGNIYAMELLYKYLESHTEGEVYSFNDLYKLNLILIPFKFNNLSSVFENVRIITDRSDVLKDIQLNLTTNPKYKLGKFLGIDKTENKVSTPDSPKKEYDRTSQKIGNIREPKRDVKISSISETKIAPKQDRSAYNKQQQQKQAIKSQDLKEKVTQKKQESYPITSPKEEVNKQETTVEKEKRTADVAVEVKNEDTEPIEHKHVETKPIEMVIEKTIPIEMMNENTIPIEMVHETIIIEKSHEKDATIKSNIKAETQNVVKSESILSTEQHEVHPIHIHEDTQAKQEISKHRMTTNYDREKTPKNPFYKTNKRGYSAPIDKPEDVVKPIGQIYKEIKASQRKEKLEVKEQKEDQKKLQSQPATEKKGEFVVPKKKVEDSVKESSGASPIKKSQQFVVPQKPTAEDIIKKKEEKSSQPDKQYKPSFKLFEPIKYQKIKPATSVVEKISVTAEPREIAISKSTYLENLENLSTQLKEEEDTFFDNYKKQNKDSIDIKLVESKFNLNYWIEKIFVVNMDEMEAEEIEKHIYSVISKVLKKYISNRDKFLMVLYSLTNPDLKNEIVLDLEYCFYQIFVNSPPEDFDLNLGHVGYQTLLNNNLLDSSIKNRENLEKIIYHMEKYYYAPNNDNIKTIMQICDKNFYPKYLKNLIDNYVLNKGIHLSEENFTLFIQIITNFEEYSQYYQNLINSSFTDFRIPVKAEFFEYLIYKYLTKLELQKMKTVLRNLNHRYITEYKDDGERMEQIYSGNNLILFTILQFIENSKAISSKKGDQDKTDMVSYSDIRSESKSFIEIINNLIAQNKSFNKDWITDNDFSFLLVRLYHHFSYNFKEYFVILDDLLANNELEALLDPKILLREILDILKYEDKKLNKEEHILAINFLDRFLEKYVRSGVIQLSFDDKFDFIREENLYKFLRFYRNLKEEDDDKSVNIDKFVKVLDTLLDQFTYMRLHKSDKTNLEKVLMRVFNNNKNRVLEYLYKFDARR
jgi:hypothetical protein